MFLANIYAMTEEWFSFRFHEKGLANMSRTQSHQRRWLIQLPLRQVEAVVCFHRVASGDTYSLISIPTELHRYRDGLRHGWLRLISSGLRFFTSPQPPDWLCAPASLLSTRHRRLFRRG
jgi:hypothetical protein